jgi:hypothetical protein
VSPYGTLLRDIPCPLVILNDDGLMRRGLTALLAVVTQQLIERGLVLFGFRLGLALGIGWGYAGGRRRTDSVARSSLHG